MLRLIFIQSHINVNNSTNSTLYIETSLDSHKYDTQVLSLALKVHIG